MATVQPVQNMGDKLDSAVPGSPRSLQLRVEERHKRLTEMEAAHKNTHMFHAELNAKQEAKAQYSCPGVEACRERVHWMLQWPGFDYCMIALVILNCIAILCESHNPPAGYEKTNLEKHMVFVDKATNGIFLLELGLRVFGETPARFFESSGNRLDAFIVLVCGLDLVVDIGGAFAAFRALRLIVLLKNIKVFAPLKAIIGALSYNVKFVGNVLLLFLIFYAIFGQFAIENLYYSLKRRCVTTDSGAVSMGPMRYCSDKSFTCPASQTCNENYGNPHHGLANFDNTGSAALILFQISTVSSWFEYVYALQDSEYAYTMLFPIVVFILIALVAASLFVAVVTHGFSEYREEQKLADKLEKERIKVAYAKRLLEAESAQDQREWEELVSHRNMLLDKGDEEPIACKHFDGIDTSSFGVNSAVERAMKLAKGQSANLSNEELKVQAEHAARLDLLKRSDQLWGTEEITSEEESETDSSRPGTGKGASAGEKVDVNVDVGYMSEEGSDSDEDLKLTEQALQAMGCCSRSIYKLAKSELFDQFIMTMIVLNTVILATVYDGMSSTHESFLDASEYIFTSIFAVEALVKILGFGPKEYFCGTNTKTNNFDFFLVVVSIIGLVFTSTTVMILRLFKLMRTLRLVRVLRRNRAIRRILDAATHSMVMVINVFFLLFLIFVSFSLVGITLYSNLILYRNEHIGYVSPCQWNTDPSSCTDTSQYVPRNFDSFFRATITLFIVMTFDGWEDVLFNAMKTKNGWIAPLYFFAFVVISAFIVINLLVAAILENLQVSDALAAAEREEQELELRQSLEEQEQPEESKPQQPEESESQTPAAKQLTADDYNLKGLRAWCQGFVRSWLYRWGMILIVSLSCVVLAFDNNSKTSSTEILIHATDVFMLLVFKVEICIKVLANGWKQQVPLFIDPASAGSCTCSSGGKVAPEPSAIDGDILEDKQPEDRSVSVAYWKSGWNRFDFAIFMLCCLDELLLLSGKSGLLYLFRSLRALRILSQLAELKRVLTTLLLAAPMLLQICALVLVVFVVFGILGLSVFVGKFKYCTDITLIAGLPFIENQDACLGIWADSDTGVMVPRAWTTYPQTFDNIFSSVATLFDVSSLDSWSDVMLHAVDIQKIDYQPIPGHSWIYAYFFIMFVFISSMFVFQMFVAVVVDSFYHVHGFFDRSDAQASLRNLYLLLEMLQPEVLAPPPDAPSDEMGSCHKAWQRARVWVYSLTNLPSPEAENYRRARVYDVALTLSLAVNVIFLMTLHHPSSSEFDSFYNTQNILFLVLYYLEAVLKFFALGINYFKDGWNWLDLLVVFGSTVAEMGVVDARAARFLRILRIFRLIKKFREVEALLKCMLRCALRVGHVVLVLVVLYYIFAIVGMQLFGNTRWGWHLNAHSNFESFGSAMLTLLKVSSGEFVGLMTDCSIESPKCIVGEDCGSIFSRAFFSSFVVLSMYITFQLFLAVVIDAFAWAYSLENRGQVDATMTAEHVQEFMREFVRLDVQHQGYIRTDQVVQLVQALPPPLGVEQPSVLWQRALRYELSLFPLRPPGQVRAQDLFLVLAVKLYGASVLHEDIVEDHVLLRELKNVSPAHCMLKASLATTQQLSSLTNQMRPTERAKMEWNSPQRKNQEDLLVEDASGASSIASSRRSSAAGH